MTRMPLKTQKQPNILPSQVLGYISPYPTVVMVATAHQQAAGILEKLLESSGAILPSSFISQKYRILGVGLVVHCDLRLLLTVIGGIDSGEIFSILDKSRN